jgi:hypothetical protein
MMHLYSQYFTQDVRAQRRHELARQTWALQSWQECPVPVEKMVRLWKDPHRSVPYFRDVIDYGAIRSPEAREILVYTNADIMVRSNASMLIAATLQGKEACYAFRQDFPSITKVLGDDEIVRGGDYCGSDLFAFRVGWWRQYGSNFPDMLIGTEAWDAVLRVLIDMSQPGPDNAIPNLIYHERHPSMWENPKNRYSLPSQKRNLRLAWDWLLKRGRHPSEFGIRKV